MSSNDNTQDEEARREAVTLQFEATAELITHRLIGARTHANTIVFLSFDNPQLIALRADLMNSMLNTFLYSLLEAMQSLRDEIIDPNAPPTDSLPARMMARLGEQADTSFWTIPQDLSTLPPEAAEALADLQTRELSPLVLPSILQMTDMGGSPSQSLSLEQVNGIVALDTVNVENRMVLVDEDLAVELDQIAALVAGRRSSSSSSLDEALGLI